MFPGSNATVYYNEAGEPLGWDYPSNDPADDYEPADDGEIEAAWERAEDEIYQEWEDRDDRPRSAVWNPEDFEEEIDRRCRRILAEWRKK